MLLALRESFNTGLIGPFSMALARSRLPLDTEERERIMVMGAAACAVCETCSVLIEVRDGWAMEADSAEAP